ncbi:MAG: SDR family oxidoreductase [Actinophytocola sp.]|uniref:SDR family oxidoreductase n=1 Tax=Actinophytocola sp. TaxID=1872138 RepID=UPI003C76F484
MTTLAGRTALVTGGSRGIGGAIATRLAADGATVYVHYGSRDAAAKETVAAIEANGGRAVAIKAELGADPGDGVALLWERFDAACAERGEPAELDILVNNVGVTLPGRIGEATVADFDRMMALNTRTPFFVTQQGLRRLRDGGRVVTLSSAVTRLALPDAIAYAMSKAALDVFTVVLAKELGTRGITVNAVSPGWTDTEPNAPVLRDDPGAAAAIAAQAALGRFGQPADVASVVAFLAGPDGAWVTGQVLDASGGMRL